MRTRIARSQPGADPLFWAIVAEAALLGVLFAGVLQVWGTGQVLVEMPWYIPTMHSFAGLAALVVAFLALGRHHVLGGPTTFWIGTGFATFSLLSGLFILTWPGLVPGGGGVLAQRPNTSGWIALLELGSLSAFLLAAVLLPWPLGPLCLGRPWYWSAGAWVGGITLIAGGSIAVEHALPALVDPQGTLTPLLLAGDVGFLLLFAVGAVLSTRRYLRSGDTLLGYMALVQVALAFVVLTALIGGKRYDIWYYLSRLLLVGAFLTMLFGLLAGYIALLRRERDRTRDAQARSAELAAVLEAVPVVVWIAHDPACQVVTGNRFGAALLRMGPRANLSRTAPEDVQPTHFRVYRHGVELGPQELPLQITAAQGVELRDFEETVVFDDGSSVTLLGNTTPLRHADGRVWGAVAAFLDITERTQTEAERARLLAEAQAAISVRDQFLQIAAHELKTPLTALLGYTELLQQRAVAGEPLPARQQHALLVVARQSQRLHKLVANLLDLSRLQAGRLQLDCAPLDLTALTRQVVEDLQPLLVRHTIRMDAPREPLIVDGDPGRLEQVLFNLLQNASKYSPDGGPIQLRCGQQAGWAYVSITDQGIGIPTADLPRIFACFYRAGNVSPDHISGMGIGLYLVHEIAALHAGRVEVTSQEGQGSTFTLWLPLHRAGGARGQGHPHLLRPDAASGTWGRANNGGANADADHSDRG